MKLKTFRARTMADALAAVKGEFGSAAVILHTKQFKVGGLLGMWGKPVVEVVASDQALGTRRGNNPDDQNPHNHELSSDQADLRSAGSRSARPPLHSRPARHAVEPKPASSNNTTHSRQAHATQAPANGTLTDRARALEAYLASSGVSQTTIASPQSTHSESFTTGNTSQQTSSSTATASRSASHTAATFQNAPAFNTPDPTQDVGVAVMPVRQRGRQSRHHRDGNNSEYTNNAANNPTGLDALITTATFAPASDADEGTIERELSTIKRLVSQLLTASPAGTAVGVLPQPLFDAHVRLIDNDVEREIADQLIGAVRDELSAGELLDPSIVRQTLLRRIEASIPVVQSAWGAKPGEPHTGKRVVALVGATGVGKTTTIAKLAATFKLRHGRRVGLVTADTYRIAAVDQLRTYAEIISLPLKVAMSPGEMQRAIDALDSVDIVLVDTAGRSPSDSARLGELGEFLDAAQPTETHLVLSATADQRVQLRTAERFAAFKPDRVILTKLDESDRHGSILNLVKRVGLPLSFVTTGQEVPDHIEHARADKLARLVLDGLQTTTTSNTIQHQPYTTTAEAAR